MNLIDIDDIGTQTPKGSPDLFLSAYLAGTADG
jgi:hypothetical protein